MKKHYRFLALLISFVMACGTPLGTLCIEAASVTGGTVVSEDAVEPQALDGEEKTEENDVIAEENVEETSDEADTRNDSIEDTSDESVIPEEPEETVEESENSEPSPQEEAVEEEAVPVTNGYCGENLTWEYAEGILSIKGTGKMYDYDEEHQPEWIVFAEELKELHIAKSITILDADAFEWLTKLEAIRFEGSEDAWEELEKEWEDKEYIEKKGKKEIFEKVTEFYFGEENPVQEEPEVIEEVIGTGQPNDSNGGAEDSLCIVTEPQDASVPVGTIISLHVVVNRDDVFYQWQWSSDGKTWKNCTSAGNDSDTFRFEMKATLNGRKYRCIVFNDSDEIMSRVTTVSVAVEEALEITKQPVNTAATGGENVSLHVEVNKADAAYKWQWSRDGQKWSNCTSAGYNTDTFGFVMKSTLNGRRYRCVVTSGDEQVISEEAVVTYVEPLKITKQPEDVTATAGETVGIHVEANKADAAYKWQWSRDGQKWSNCTSAGYNTDTFEFVMKSTLNGRRYRCVVMSGDEQVISEEAVVTYVEPLKITKQPEDVTAAAGETVGVHVEANKADAAYKWQWSRDGQKWSNCTSAGYNTDTFGFVVRATLNGRRYRCVVTSGDEQVISEEAVVTYVEPLKITKQPEDLTATAGETASFHVEVNKADAAYKWQWSRDGQNWSNCTSAGCNTDTFGFVMKSTLNGRRYRCVVTSGDEQVTSEEAVVTYLERLEITKQPESMTAAAGETVGVHIETNKADAAYQWQWSRDGQSWSNCTSAGYNTDTFSFVMKERLNGRQYRCIVTSGDEQVISLSATMTFEEALKITAQPEDVTAGAGVTVNFHVEANKTDVTYQWQWSTDGTTWKNCGSAGYNTATMHFVMYKYYNGRQYRCNITCGTEKVTSEAALLTFAGSGIEIDGVIYELIDGTMTVTGYRGSADTVVVQETVDGHTVTVIGESAFEGSSIKSIDLPDTIQLIKKRAFANCNNLMNMT